MRDLAIKLLKEHNKNSAGSMITRLYYGDDGEYVEDFSFFLCNSDYFSHDLFDVIRNGQSLTSEQEKEKSRFVTEGDLKTLINRKLGTDIEKYSWELKSGNDKREDTDKNPSQNITININLLDEDKIDTEKFSKQLVNEIKKVRDMR